MISVIMIHQISFIAIPVVTMTTFVRIVALSVNDLLNDVCLGYY